MSTLLSTRLRSTISLMVLLAVFITLLPAQRASAQLTFPLTRQQTNHVFYEWYLKNLSKGIMAERMVVGHLISTTPLSTTEATEQLTALTNRYYDLLGPRGADPAYRKSLPTSTLTRALYDAGVQTPAFRASVVDAYRGVQKAYADAQILDDLNPHRSAAYEAATQESALSDALRSLLIQQSAQAEVRAKTDPEFARLWDKHVVVDDTISIKDFDTLTFLIEHPEAPVPQALRDAVKPDGSMELSLTDLEQLAKAEFAKLNGSIDDMQKTLVEISAQQDELLDAIGDLQAQAKAEAKYKEHQAKLQAASSAISIISTLISFEDPELGNQVAVVGQSLVKVGDSLSGWMQATAGLSGLSKLGSLSTVVMTGNVLAAVMGVVSLFGPQQPTPEQLILEEIGKLRQQVDQLRSEMHTRFDQIDKELNAIYSTMHDRFNQIDLKLGKLTASLEEIQQSLLTLSIQLNRMERNNVEYLDALGRRPLREAINGALDYRERTGVDMPYQPDFVSYENVFHTWATINAFDALSAGPTQRDYSDGQVLAELSAAPLDANLNYLNGWLQAHGMTPFANKRLPSPRDWAFASRAYAELGFDSPEHLKRIASQRQAALDAVGNDLQQALQNISTIQTPSGTQGNAPLWSGLTGYYSAKLQRLDSALRASEATYAGELQAALKREVPLDLYGGPDQALPSPYRPADFRTITCGTAGMPQGGLAAPHHLKNIIANYSRFALADYLQLNPLKACVYGEWVSVEPPCQFTPCYRAGRLRVFILVRSDNVILARGELPVVESFYDPDVWSKIAPTWNTYWKPQFEQLFAKQITPPPLSSEAAKQLDKVSGALSSKMAELQRAHAGRVLNELNGGALRAPAVELAGAKKLLESFITLGFPQAIASDDFLRSLLFSQESLVDDQQVALAYAKPASAAPRATEAIGEAEPLLNPRVTLLQTAQKRREALSGLLTDYLGSISTESYREDVALVAGTRFDLQLARTFADPNAPSPGPGQAVFLPLLRR